MSKATKKVVKKKKQAKKRVSKKRVRKKAVKSQVPERTADDVLSLSPELKYHILCFSADLDIEHDTYDTNEAFMTALTARVTKHGAENWDIRAFFGAEIEIPEPKKVLAVEVFGKEHRSEV